MNREALERLSKDDLIALVLALADQVEKLSARVAALEAEAGKPPKTPDNSSVPPSKGEKANRPERAKKQRPGRPGTSRALAEHPDRTVEAFADACPHCQQPLIPADQPEVHAYDHLDLPPIKPVVTRIERHRGVCPCCRKGFSAPVPEGLEPGSPFGPSIVALIVHLHITQAISFERLVRLMSEVFGLSISEGAIDNMLKRSEPALTQAAEAIADVVRASPVIASDETSARVEGKTWWQWVLMNTTAVYYVIVETRAASVITDFLGGVRPEVWVADRYAGQAGHADSRQVCLAHLLRDAQYAIDEGDTIFAPGFKFLLLRAMAIGRRRPDLKDTTLRHYRSDLDRRLDRLLSQPPTTPAALRLFKAMRRDRDDLFRFVTRRDVPYTNNGCERALRSSVIFRKVTGCFRSQIGAKIYAAAQSVIATGRLSGKSALQALAETFLPKQQTVTP
jgi:transposase